MDINLIGVPLMYGCDRYGVQYGPDKLREHDMVGIIEKQGHTVKDLGNVDVPEASEADKYVDHPKLKYLNPVAETNNNLAKKVYESLNEKSFPFVIGGDHSLGIGSIAGASKYAKDIAVIWIDAHGDINTHETSPSGNIHGMPLAASMNLGHPNLTNVFYDGKKVKPENVYILGARDLDKGEVILAEELDLNLYTMDTIREKSLEVVIKEIIEKVNLSNVDGVHLSFDIDVLDSSIVPGTGTPVVSGLTLNEGKSLFTKFLGEGFVTSMDFVEFNPELEDENKTTLNTCLEMLDHIASNLPK